VRFKEDPVRMIRAIRFSQKLNAELSNEIQDCIMEQAPLLSNISLYFTRTKSSNFNKITRTKHDMH
jgi:tRNA nucleotidyltransferase/poly(A) polymerase